MKWPTLTLVVLLAYSGFMFLSGCKTTEDIQREKMVDQLSLDLAHNQKLAAQITSELQRINERINLLEGKLDELQHSKDQQKDQAIKSVHETLSLLQSKVGQLEESSGKQAENLTDLQAELNSTKELGQEIMDNLQKVTTSLEKTGKKDKDKKDDKSKVENGFKAFDAKDYTKAKSFLTEVLDQKLTPAQQTGVWYRLGVAEFNLKNYENALIYLSKVYTQNPKSTHAPTALLYIGKSFKESKKKAEASASFEELTKKYPKSSQAAVAKNLLNELK